jgi:hypothetical protein
MTVGTEFRLSLPFWRWAGRRDNNSRATPVQKTQEILGRGVSRKAFRSPTPGVVVLLMVNLALLAGAAWAMATYGSIGRAVRYHLRGETLFVDSTEKSFGVAAWGETRNVTFKMVNCGPTPIRILGCNSPCSCLVQNNFPFTIPENGTRDLVIPVRLSRREDGPSTIHLDAELTLFTSVAGHK